MANKKINQLVLKTTIQSTDLFPLGDATTGQLFKKTIAELQAAIGGAVISVNGLVGTVVLDTDDIQELASPTNRYFTEARSRAAISLTTTGNSGASTYSNSTGVLNVPTYTLAGLGGITATFLSGGTGITYNSSTGVIAYSGTVYTDASIRALFSAGTGISYNSSTGAITNSAPDQVVSIAGGTGITVTGTYPSFTVAYSGTVYTDSSVRALFSGTAPITYNSSTGAIGITQSSGSTNGFLSSTDWTTFNSKQSALTLGNLTEATSSVLTITGGTGSVIGSGTSIQVKQASSTVSGFLSSTDWNTFNNKQGTITLTTTGTSGAATFSGGTLNIPQYQAVLTNPVTGTGTTNYVTKWTSSSAIGNSQIFDNGTAVGIGVTPSAWASGTFPRVLQVGNASLVTNSAAFAQITNNMFFDGTSYKYITTNGASRIILESGGDITFNNVSSGTAGNTATTVERMRIDSSGNVGIGTTSPSNRLHIVSSSTSAAGLLITGGSNVQGDATSGQILLGNTAANQGAISYGNLTGYVYIDNSWNNNDGDIRFRTKTSGTAINAVTIKGSGDVGIGTSSPGLKFDLVGGTNLTGTVFATFRATQDQTTYRGVNIGYDTSGQIGVIYPESAGAASSLAFWTYNGTGTWAEKLRITGGGNILMGTTTDNGERLYVSGSIRATGSITANSDARLKKNIERIENALEKVGQISGYTYNTIYDEDRHAGVIAQEIDKVLPEIVNKGNDGLMGVEYGNISALLIEAIKDLKKDNESLRAIVEGLSK